jgi:hypothetical protein
MLRLLQRATARLVIWIYIGGFWKLPISVLKLPMDYSHSFDFIM